MAEAIPSRGAHFVIVPLRNDVVVPQQNAIERSRSRLEVGTVLGDMFKEFPDKPKHMHWRTYNRLWRAHNIAEERTNHDTVRAPC